MEKHYKKIEDIPNYLASEKEWHRRGYRLITFEKPKRAASVGAWNGMYYLNFDLYHFGDVVPIISRKAQIRRVNFWLKMTEQGEEYSRWLQK